MTAAEQRRLDGDGYLILESFMESSLLEALRDGVEQLFAAEGEQAGAEFRQEPNARRLANLAAKGSVFQDIITRPEILDGVAHVLGPRFKLSSLNARSANPYADCRQPLHADAGAVADEQGFWVCNTVWMLDDFTTENGAIRMVPGSHRWGQLPQQGMADPLQPHPEEVLLRGRAGDVVIMNAHMWHGATANLTGGHRRAVHGFYCRWDKPQQQYQKKLIPADQQQGFSPLLRQLLALDDPLNDQLSSSQSGRSGFLK